MSDVVGTAYVRIRAITTQIASDIDDGLNKSGAKAKIAAAGQGAGRTIGREVSTETGKEMSRTMPAATQGALRDSFKGADRTIRDAYRKGFAAVESDLPSWTKPINTTLSSALRKAGVSSGNTFGTELSRNVLRGVNKMDDDVRASLLRRTPLWKRLGEGFGRTIGLGIHDGVKKKNPLASIWESFSKFKIPGPAWLGIIGLPALGGAAKIAASYIIGLVGLVGNLGQAFTGMATAGAGAFAALGLAAIPVFLAFKTQTPALLKFQEAAKGVGKEWQKVGAATQTTLLPGLSKALKQSEKLIPAFSQFGQVIGQAVGDWAKWTMATLTTERNLFLIKNTLAGSTEVTQRFLGAIRDGIASLPSLLSAVMPSAKRMASDIEGLMGSFRAHIEAASKSGSLQAFFDKAYEAGRKLAGALTDVVVGVFNILRIGGETAQPFMDRFDQWAERFRTWTQSTEGQNRIRQVFDAALPVMHEVNLLFMEILGMITKPIVGGDTSGVVGFLQTLRLDVLPAIQDMVQTITQNIDKGALEGLVKNFADLFAELAKGNSIANALGVINLGLEALTTILSAPIIGDGIGNLLGLLGALKGFQLLAKYTGMEAVAKGIFQIAAGMNAAKVAAAGGEVSAWFSKTVQAGGPLVNIGKSIGAAGGPWAAMTGIFGSVATAVSGAATSFIALSVPIGAVTVPVWAIVAAVAAVVGVFALLYTKVKPVHDAVDAFGRMIKNTVGAIWDWLTAGDHLKTTLEVLGTVILGPVGALIMLYDKFKPFKDLINSIVGLFKDLFTGNFSKLGEDLGKIGEAFVNFVSSVGSILAGLPGKIAGWVSGAASALWGWIQDAVPQALGKLGEFGAAVGGWLVGLGGMVLGWVGDAGKALISWIADQVPQIPRYLGLALGFVTGWLIRLPFEIASLVTKATSALFGWIIDAAPGVLSALGNLWTTVMTSILTFIDNIPGWVASGASALWGWITDAVPKAADAWTDFNKKLADRIKSFFTSDLPGFFADGVPALWGWIEDAGPKVGSALGDFAKTVFTFLTVQLPAKVLDGLSTLGGVFLGAVKSAWSGFLDGLNNALPGIEKWFQDLPGKITGFIGDAGRWLWDTGGAIIRGLKDGLVFLWESEVRGALIFFDWFMDIVKDAPGWLWDTGGAIIRGLKDGLIFLWTSEIKGALAIGSWFLDIVKDAPGWLWDTGGAIIRGLKDGLIWLWTAEIKGALTIGQWILDLLKDAPGLLFDTGKKVIQGLYDGVKWLWDTSIKGTLNILQWIKDALPDALGWLRDVGSDVVEGLKNGIMDAASDLKDWLIDHLPLPGILKDYLRGHSPSMVFFDIGVDVVEGLKLGIQRRSGAALDAVRALSRDLTNAAQIQSSFSVAGVNAGAQGGSTASALQKLLVATQNPQFDVKVMIGDRDITDIVDFQIKAKDEERARVLTGRGIG